MKLIKDVLNTLKNVFVNEEKATIVMLETLCASHCILVCVSIINVLLCYKYPEVCFCFG